MWEKLPADSEGELTDKLTLTDKELIQLEQTEMFAKSEAEASEGTLM
jgi:hypothetical protein